jgi:hypothetical protein
LNSFSQRSYNRDKKRDIEGKIIISIIETLELKIPVAQSNVFVKISVKSIDQDNDKNYETSIISNTLTP